MVFSRLLPNTSNHLFTFLNGLTTVHKQVKKTTRILITGCTLSLWLLELGNVCILPSFCKPCQSYLKSFIFPKNKSHATRNFSIYLSSLLFCVGFVDYVACTGVFPQHFECNVWDPVACKQKKKLSIILFPRGLVQHLALSSQ